MANKTKGLVLAKHDTVSSSSRTIHGKLINICLNDSRSDCADVRLNSGLAWRLSMEFEGAEVDVAGVG